MQTKQIQLSKDEIDHAMKMESSIEHWSMAHTKHQIEADNALANVRNIFTAKGQFFNKKLQEASIPPEKIRSSSIERSEDGTAFMLVHYEETMGDQPGSTDSTH